MGFESYHQCVFKSFESSSATSSELDKITSTIESTDKDQSPEHKGDEIKVEKTEQLTYNYKKNNDGDNDNNWKATKEWVERLLKSS